MEFFRAYLVVLPPAGDGTRGAPLRIGGAMITAQDITLDIHTGIARAPPTPGSAE